jgi:hypothetical protein
MFIDSEYLLLTYPIDSSNFIHKIDKDIDNNIVCNIKTRFLCGTWVQLQIKNNTTCYDIKHQIEIEYKISKKFIKLLDENGIEINDLQVMFLSNLLLTFYIFSQYAPYPVTYNDFSPKAQQLLETVYDFHTNYIYCGSHYNEYNIDSPDIVYHYKLKKNTNETKCDIEIDFDNILWSYCSSKLYDTDNLMKYITDIILPKIKSNIKNTFLLKYAYYIFNSQHLINKRKIGILTNDFILPSYDFDITSIKDIIDYEKYRYEIIKKENKENYFMDWHFDNAKIIKNKKDFIKNKLSDNQTVISDKYTINYYLEKPVYTLIIYTCDYDKDFIGGTLEFIDGHIIYPKYGLYVLFDSRELHKVNILKKGVRTHFLIKFYNK